MQNWCHCADKYCWTAKLLKSYMIKSVTGLIVIKHQTKVFAASCGFHRSKTCWSCCNFFLQIVILIFLLLYVSTKTGKKEEQLCKFYLLGSWFGIVSGLSSIFPNLDVPVSTAGGEDFGVVVVPCHLKHHIQQVGTWSDHLGKYTRPTRNTTFSRLEHEVITLVSTQDQPETPHSAGWNIKWLPW